MFSYRPSYTSLTGCEVGEWPGGGRQAVDRAEEVQEGGRSPRGLRLPFPRRMGGGRGEETRSTVIFSFPPVSFLPAILQFLFVRAGMYGEDSSSSSRTPVSPVLLHSLYLSNS